MDYNNPDVTLFVKQLKTGTYKMKNDKGVVEVPHFTEEDIPELLNYAEDLTIIPSFPSVYNMNNGKIRLGECMLWVIESIRQGTPPSLGCKMVLANGENYEALYLLIAKLGPALLPGRRRRPGCGRLPRSAVGRKTIPEDAVDD